MNLAPGYQRPEDAIRAILQALRGRILLGLPSDSGKTKNCDLDPTITLTIVAANTDTTATHNLNRKPEVYVVIGQAQAGSVYDSSAGTTNWTASQIELRASATGTYKLMVW